MALTKFVCPGSGLFLQVTDSMFSICLFVSIRLFLALKWKARYKSLPWVKGLAGCASSRGPIINQLWEQSHYYSFLFCADMFLLRPHHRLWLHREELVPSGVLRHHHAHTVLPPEDPGCGHFCHIPLRPVVTTISSKVFCTNSRRASYALVVGLAVNLPPLACFVFGLDGGHGP